MWLRTFGVYPARRRRISGDSARSLAENETAARRHRRSCVYAQDEFSKLHDAVVRLRTAVAIELPGVADLADLVHVEVGGDERVCIARADGKHLAARIAEVALAVELADVPGCFVADAIDGADEVAVGDGVGRLLQLPEVLREAGYGGRGIHDDFRACQSQLSRSLGEVPVVADVDADLGVGGLEDWIAEV